MTKQVFVFDEYVSSQKNGIGSFLKEFCYCMKRLDAAVCMLAFNADVKELTVERDEQGNMTRMLFPLFPAGQFVHHAETVVRLLRLYIGDSAGNLFFVNHSPCEKLVEALKEGYPMSKVIFVVHDMGWTSGCLGDERRFRQLVAGADDEQADLQHIRDFYAKELKAFGCVDRVVCLSEDTRDLLRTVYALPSEKIFLIPNGLQAYDGDGGIRHFTREELKKELFVPVDERIILYVGRPTRQKGMYALLDAFHAVLKKNPDVRLVVIGSDNGNRIENLLAVSSSFAARVSFLGLISKRELEKWYAVADMGVIPSYYEQCPYVGIEMMMHGLPLVVSDGFGLRNMFQNGVNALAAPVGDREDSKVFAHHLAEAMDKLLHSEGLRTVLGKNARAAYCSRYDIKQMLMGYENLFSSLLKKGDETM